MSQKSTTHLYLGADMSKATIDCRIADRAFSVSNDRAGFAAFAARIRPFSHEIVHVVCEASGGCQRKFVEHLHAKSILVSVVNARQVRDFARSRNILAKTDRLDAAVLAEYGRSNSPEPTPAKPAHLQRLADLLSSRDHLVAQRAAEKTRLHQIEDRWLQLQTKRTIAFFTREIEKLDAQLARLRTAHPDLDAKANRLQEATGIGTHSSLALLGYMPELGTLGRRAVAKLAGLAPLNHDSGQMRRQRHIAGGRGQVRRLLYMASLSAIRGNPILRAFYTKLRATGKSAKVSLSAVSRKLIVLLNSALKNPQITLAK
jgi:transposase